MKLYHAKRFLIAIFLLSLLIHISPSVGQAGIGIGLSSMYVIMNGKLGESMSTTVGVINPSPYDLKARVYFDCTNCKKDVYIFGHKIGEIVEDPYQLISLDKQEVYVPANTMGTGIPVTITLTPKLILIKEFRFWLPKSLTFLVKLFNKNFDGAISVPYPSLLLETKTLEGRIIASVFWSSFGAAGVTPAVSSTYIAKIEGMPVGTLIILIIGFALVVFFLLRKRKKIFYFVFKFKGKKERSRKQKKK